MNRSIGGPSGRCGRGLPPFGSRNFLLTCSHELAERLSRKQIVEKVKKLVKANAVICGFEIGTAAEGPPENDLDIIDFIAGEDPPAALEAPADETLLPPGCWAKVPS